MKQITCEIEILTPMFLGGAKQTDDGKSIRELRAQSIKGVLRYWYRALVGPDRLKEKDNKGGNEEDNLFGSSNERIGASKVKIVITGKSLQPYGKAKFDAIAGYGFKHPTRGFSINPLDYLAYGVVDNKKQIVREAFSPGGTFYLKFSLINLTDIQIDKIDDFYKSLYLMINFGGLGSRSRKGFGALKLLNEDDVYNGQDWFVKGDVSQTLRNIINNKTPVKPLYNKEYSYLDTDTKFWLFNKEADSWEGCLSMLGKDYHDWRQVLAVANGRENLGTPLLHGNRQFENERRASSYFLTIFKLDKEKYKYGVLHIPSNYSGNMIPDNVQKEHHEKFQKEIEKTATKEV